MTAEAEVEELVETWDGTPVPPERWGEDHMSTLAYIETINVDSNGQPVSERMRSKSGAPRRGKVLNPDVPPPSGDYPTILKDGVKLSGHDDWDCVDDMVAAHVVDHRGSSFNPVLRLTERGWALAHAGRRHLCSAMQAGRRSWARFDAASHLPPILTAEEVARTQEMLKSAEWTRVELDETVNLMRSLVHQFYGACFQADMATKCHPFMEFNGIMSKYVDICRMAAREGQVYPQASIHSGVPLPLAKHDVEYFAEKFSCIFGPFFAAHPELAQYFCDVLVRGKQS